jgi:dTDP-4-dehydrorhamnose reductase
VKILILGGRGMAGHMMAAYLGEFPEYQVYFTTRDPSDKEGIYLDAADSIMLEKVMDQIKPDFVINCIGILNSQAAENQKLAFLLNSLLPHQLAMLAERYGGRLVHISTDCVFSGEQGSYKENDFPNGKSVYAQSKQLGEIVDNRHLTIRTSIIGPELKEDGIGLFLWFMKQQGRIKGFTNAFWNGVTTLELAKAVQWSITNGKAGLCHLGGKQKISKHDLLILIQKIFKKPDVEIIPDSEFVLDRTIVNTRTDFDYHVPSYEEMLLELRDWMERH